MNSPLVNIDASSAMRREAVAEAAVVLWRAAAMLQSAAELGSDNVVEASLKVAREAVVTAISCWRGHPEVANGTSA
jgi:hypothetical protein